VAFRQADLRKQLPGNPQPNQGTTDDKSSVTWHWNGPPVRLSDLDQLWEDAEYHLDKNWGTPQRPAYANGIQYEWAVGGDGTQYKLRNDGASLWHCSVYEGNVHSVSCTFLIGEGQRITKAARESAKELTDKLRSKYGIPQGKVYGHREWSSTACPGTAQKDFVEPYRAGQIRPQEPPGKKWDIEKYTFVAGGDWAARRCEFAVDLINEKAGKRLARWTGQTDRAVYASQVCYENPTVGGRVCIVAGKSGPKKLSEDARSVFGLYDKDASDIWDATANGELWDAMVEIERREKLSGIAAAYNKKWGGNPAGKEPSPAPPVDVGPYAPDSVERIDHFFDYIPDRDAWNVPYEPIGRLLAEEADGAGLDLALCCALIEAESKGRNVFGCDRGGPFCHARVTQDKCQHLIAHLRAGGTSQGVGPAQITWRDFLYEAERIGGLHLPKCSVRVGFGVLADLLNRYPYPESIERYNGYKGPGVYPYARKVIGLQDQWKKRLS
jgi:hypothetical protein